MRSEVAVADAIGYFRIFAKPPGGTRREITMFRGAPITLGQLQTADPFTDVSLTLDFPQITVFDKLGQGDLDWLIPYADIDVVWENTGVYNFDWSWEGFIVSPNFSMAADSSSVSVECKGALYLLDNYLAEPRFPSNPIPYERLIKMAFDQDSHPSRLDRLKVVFPDGWDTVVPPFNHPDFLGFLKPWGVIEGQKWTGLTSRTTGSWDPLLTGYVQGLLSVMYDTGGAQWTVRKDTGRKPVLYLREIPARDDDQIIVIDLLNPGITISGSRDFTQSANIIFGEGSDTAGVTFSGMQVNSSGRATSYIPFAHASAVWPATKNPNFNKNIIAKQTHIKFPAGLDELAARRVAEAQLQRFADPGITGNMTLTSDVQLQDGTPFPAMLIKGGRSVLIKGLFGTNVLAHITEAAYANDTKTVSLTFDTKYRDQLTVSEVMARTRDALTPLRSLQVGKYSNTVQDLLLPWSYREGSGMLPSASRKFYEDIPDGISFPYEEWTIKHPPKDPHSQKFYIKLDKANRNNATMNWAGEIENIDYTSPSHMYRSLFDADHPNDSSIDKTITIRWNATEPSSATKNDVWIDTITSRKYIYDGSKWSIFHDSTFFSCISLLPNDLNATTTKMFFMTASPPTPANDDLWIKRPSGTVAVRRAGAWVDTDVGEPPPPTKKGIAIRMSQSGTVRLSQIAAYDKNGNVKPVRFHVSIYDSPGVTNTAMPQLYKLASTDALPRYLHPPGGDNYKSGQRMPFYDGAFENVKKDGTQSDTAKPLPAGVNIMVGWGNYYEPAGYSPGRFSRHADRTGVLTDETAWSWDLTQYLSQYDRKDNAKNPDAGMLYVMIYCDDDDTEPTYIMGRFYRAEPGV